MIFDDPRLLDLADVVADGGPVAWGGLESETSDPKTRSLIRQFRVLAQLAELHREPADSPDAGTPAGPSANAAFQDSAEAPTTTQSTLDGVWHWGTFEVRERIGAGGFGTVYRAWDPALHTHVALKLLHPNLPGAAQHESSLVEEARRLAQVRHPNVIVVHGADRHRGIVGFWMELIKGRTLVDVLRTRGVFGAREAGLIGIEMCQALAAVHHSGLVHGDLKARNVMREDGGRHVLMDFGAALDLQTAAALVPLPIVGTPAYMAPEALAGDRVTPQSDIYSLGVLLFHLVSNEFPVKGSSAEEIGRAHARGDRRRLRDARPDLPSVFIQTVEQALDPNPSSRFESAGAMEAALQPTLSQGASSVITAPGGTPAVSRSTTPSLEPRRVLRRRSVVAALAGLVAAGILGVGAWVFQSADRPAAGDAGTGYAPSRSCLSKISAGRSSNIFRMA